MQLSTQLVTLAAFVASAPLALAQSPVWGQCGGQGWTGPTANMCIWLRLYLQQPILLPVHSCKISVSRVYHTSDLDRYLVVQGSNPTPTSATSNPTGGNPQPTGSTLAAIGKSIGLKYVGGATDPGGDFADTAFVNTYTREFNAATPVNSMKWDATERSRNVFTFGTSDQLVAWAQQRNMIIRGHTCLWHAQLPSWVSNGGFNAATLTQVIQNHVSNVVGHFKGKLYMYVQISHFHDVKLNVIHFFKDAWDVVNEIFNEDGTFRRSVFYNTLGESFVEIAFRAARAADPNAKLYINDYNTDSTNAKSAGLLNLVKKLKARGVPIDGIGVQAHLIVGQVPSTFQANLQQFASAGVEVAITELDIRMRTPAMQADLAQQQRDYQTVFAACKRVPACVGIQVWGLTDKYSWVPGTFNGYGAALPFDNNYNKKPAYNGIVAGMRS
ncbi:glycoside hydrolase superfamily [Panaeolus papilionaceus]|nr:glycoside hydrolase superfamily [Panaeolus papilionaceus]